jgi:hypothetical protein
MNQGMQGGHSRLCREVGSGANRVRFSGRHEFRNSLIRRPLRKGLAKKAPESNFEPSLLWAAYRFVPPLW